jgi:HSP20 family protein
MLFALDPFRQWDRTPALPIDAYRRGDGFVVQVDLPGVAPESIDVTVDRNVVTIRAERARQAVEGDRVVAAERPQGTFTRRLQLGRALDASRVEASYEHGVLTLTVPVAEEAKPRRIEIAPRQAAA